MLEVQHMHILIIENEVEDSIDLRMKLEVLNVKEVNTVDNFEESLEELTAGKYDLVFVDVFLKGREKGTELANLFFLKKIPFIVITKLADISYFDDIKKYDPLAYFQKPVDPLALRFRVESLCKEINDQASDFIFHRTGSDYRRFEKATINYVEGEGNYVSVFTDREKFLMRQSLKSFLSTLDPRLFIQIHRKWIVRLDKVDSFNSEMNILKMGDESFPVGRTFRSKLIKRLRS